MQGRVWGCGLLTHQHGWTRRVAAACTDVCFLSHLCVQYELKNFHDSFITQRDNYSFQWSNLTLKHSLYVNSWEERIQLTEVDSGISFLQKQSILLLILEFLADLPGYKPRWRNTCRSIYIRRCPTSLNYMLRNFKRLYVPLPIGKWPSSSYFLRQWQYTCTCSSVCGCVD